MQCSCQCVTRSIIKMRVVERKLGEILSLLANLYFKYLTLNFLTMSHFSPTVYQPTGILSLSIKLKSGNTTSYQSQLGQAIYICNLTRPQIFQIILKIYIYLPKKYVLLFTVIIVKIFHIKYVM